MSRAGREMGVEKESSPSDLNCRKEAEVRAKVRINAVKKK